MSMKFFFLQNSFFFKLDKNNLKDENVKKTYF